MLARSTTFLAGARRQALPLIQRAAEAEQREPHGDGHEQHQREHVHLHIGEAGALQRDAAHDAQEMRERQRGANGLRPFRHAAEREHEARQQDIGRKKKNVICTACS